jgi:hypothetical protein
VRVREDTARGWRDLITPGASDVLVVLLVHLVAYFTVRKLDSVEGTRSLQVSERAEDRGGIGFDATLSKGLIDLVNRPPMVHTRSEEGGDGVADVARTCHGTNNTLFANPMQNLF